MKSRDLQSGFFCLVLGIVFAAASLQQGLMRKGVPGPGFLPFLTAILFIGLSLGVLVPALRGAKAKEKTEAGTRFFPENDSAKKVLLGLVALFAYGLLLSFAGYLITTLMFMLFILRLVEPVPWKTVVWTGLATAVISYLLFVVLLEVQLPQGFVGF
jgi:RsiW-degrading membrane proteinase PrsW (M82 family)